MDIVASPSCQALSLSGGGRAGHPIRWRQAYRDRGEAGLINKRSVPHNHPNKTPHEVLEKVLHLRRKYHLGPQRITWYLERYHGIQISGAGVYRILRRNGLNRLPRGTRVRKSTPSATANRCPAITSRWT